MANIKPNVVLANWPFEQLSHEYDLLAMQFDDRQKSDMYKDVLDNLESILRVSDGLISSLGAELCLNPRKKFQRGSLRSFNASEIGNNNNEVMDVDFSRSLDVCVGSFTRQLLVKIDLEIDKNSIFRMVEMESIKSQFSWRESLFVNNIMQCFSFAQSGRGVVSFQFEIGVPTTHTPEDVSSFYLFNSDKNSYYVSRATMSFPTGHTFVNRYRDPCIFLSEFRTGGDITYFASQDPGSRTVISPLIFSKTGAESEVCLFSYDGVSMVGVRLPDGLEDLKEDRLSFSENDNLLLRMAGKENEILFDKNFNLRDIGLPII